METKLKIKRGPPRKYRRLDRRNCSGEAAMLAEIAVLGGGSFSAGVALLYTMHLKRGAGRLSLPKTRNGRGRGD